MRVVLYSRVSTDKQAQDGHGLAAQHTRLCEFAEQRRLDVLYTVADEGVSGSTMQRDGMQRVLNLVVAQMVDAVVVTKADRISRNVRDLLNLSATLEEHGVALVTADEQFDMTTPLGKAMSAMRAVFAQLERDMAASRTRDGMAAAKAKGVRLGRPPVGWRIEAGRWHPTDRYALVERAHTRRGEGWTLAAVADELNRDGVPTGSGRGRWAVPAVRRLLAAPLAHDVSEAGGDV
ncbi:MAG: putative resolvase [Thermoleophilia bacterium]|jgi:DNA invertase Pin-like site-specific DNA recombinase|nr:putative resolvase [Thermoleophilia bacterium]